MSVAVAPPPAAFISGLVRRHPVAAFFVAAYALSWSYWIPLAISGARVDFGSSATHVPGLFGPAAAALLVAFALEGRQAVWRLLRACVSFRGSRGWLTFAVLTPLVLFAGVCLVAGVPPLAELGVFGGFPRAGVLPMWGMLLLASYGEELGWRGFALPHLQRHHPALSATVLLTCAWAAWHMPAFFVLAGYGEMSLAVIAGFFASMLGGSFLLTWLFNRTGGSVLIVSLWHASFNLVSGTQAGRGSRAAIVSIAIMIFGYALAALDLAARRKGKPAVLGPA